jgi:hypothetical protein
MRNITVKNIFFCLFILIALSACSEKGKPSETEASKADSTASVKKDSAEIEEGKEMKDALDVVKK